VPRDRANLRTDLWADTSWRGLTYGAQWLYQHILTTSTLNACGVADWRTVRIAAMSVNVTPELVEEFAAELERHYFLVIDRDTEEVLIRSFFRHDGILLQPNPMKGALRQFAGIASGLLRGVIAHEMNRLQQENPNGFSKDGHGFNVWALEGMKTLLGSPQIDVKNPSGNPSANPSLKGSANPSVNPSPTSTSTSTPTDASHPGEEAEPKKAKETRLPKDWVPITSHYDLAKERGVDVAAEVDAFRLHAETHDRHAARWNAAFTTWLKKSKPRSTAGAARQGITPEEMLRRRDEAMSRG
jgi:hypothetical protein